jgi:lysophospholipase L1-like esterase
MGMPPSRKKNEIESSKHIINNPVADEINTDTFIGWPMMTQIGGFSCGSLLYDADPKREKYFINYDNVHPNALGQEFISELLFEKVKEHGSI